MEDLKLAILIDADNISPKYVKVILDEAATFGVAACKRIYGDWSDVRLKSWKDALLNNSIIPIQQYSYTTGKNATDSAMIIDAMGMLYGGNLDASASSRRTATLRGWPPVCVKPENSSSVWARAKRSAPSSRRATSSNTWI